MPAFTLEKPTYCGLEEHIHTEECCRYELVCTLDGIDGPVATGSDFFDTVELVTAEEAGYTCRKTETAEITESITTQSFLPAPVQAGDVGGTLTIYRDGQLLQTIDLVAANDVPKGGVFRTWKKLLGLIF